MQIVGEQIKYLSISKTFYQQENYRKINCFQNGNSSNRRKQKGQEQLISEQIKAKSNQNEGFNILAPELSIEQAMMDYKHLGYYLSFLFTFIERYYFIYLLILNKYMTKQQAIQLFEQKQVRTIWDDEQEKWYFSIVDVVAVLTDSTDATAYWRKLKQRLKAEGNETVTNCHGLKMRAVDGKMRLTDVADTEQLFRLIQSIPSPKAEPFKQWMASVASERLDQIQDPELSIEQAMMDYKRLGYSDNWINQRLKSIEIRKDLTDEWKKHGLQEGVHFATLTDIIYQTWADKTAKEYKQF